MQQFIDLHAGELQEDASLASALEELRTISPLRVHSSDFKYLRLLARGGYASVYLVRKKSTGDVFAIKVFKRVRERIQARVDRNSLATEGAILSAHRSRYLIRSFFYLHTVHHYMLVLEYLAGGDMGLMLANVGFIEEEAARFYTSEVLLGVSYLHSEGVLHRDIKVRHGGSANTQCHAQYITRSHSPLTNLVPH